MKVSCVFLARKINFGGSFVLDAIDMRGPALKVKSVFTSMDYDPVTGEVVIVTTPRCGITAGKAGRVRIPGSAVSLVVEAEEPAKAEGKKGA